MRAVVKWLTEAQGGRTKPPAGEGSAPYSPVIRLSDERWPAPVAWSVSVEKVEASNNPYRWTADIRFRVDEAPHDSLREGREFDLYEGKRLVARGRITVNPRKRRKSGASS